jgi:hypothetical protein
MLVALAAAALAIVQEAPPGPSIEAEDLAGATRNLEAEALPLADPRAVGAWIVRPRGFPAAERERRPSKPRARVTLVGGDELGAAVVGGKGEVLTLELAGGVEVPFDLSGLRSLVFTGRVSSEERVGLSAAKEGDRLYRRAAALDVVDGTLEGFEPEGVRFDSVLGARTIPWDEVAALFIEALDPGRRSGAGERVPVTVDFAGPEGGRVRGGLVALEREHCRIVLGSATEVALPLAVVAEVVVADGRLTFLSELVPTGETGRGAPFGDELGLVWPHRMDESVGGGALVVNGVVHRRGIGMHAPSRLAFALDGEPARLRGRVAIDDAARINPPAARGSVLFRVRADGELLWESPLVRGGDLPLSMPELDLAGRAELVLEVDPAGDFAGDRADWLDLVRVR